MAIVDDYAKTSIKALSGLMRDRRRNVDEKLFVSQRAGTGFPLQPLVGSGTNQRTVDQRQTGWAEALRYQRRHHLKGWDKYTSRFDLGGQFYSRTVTQGDPTPVFVRNVINGSSANTWVYPSFAQWSTGQAIAGGKISQIGHGDLMCLDAASMFALGSHAIAETLPSVPEVSIAQTLGELREGLPSMIGRNTVKDGGIHSAGDEYLNFTFGIKPIINDIMKYIDVSENYDEFVRQYNRENGRMVRRKLSLGKSFASEQLPSVSGTRPYPNLGASFYSAGVTETSRTTEVEVWASLAYRVGLPQVDMGGFDVLKDFTRTYGVLPTLDTAWNLFPFSWLLDWVVNLDDLIKNVSYLGQSFNGVSLQRGYVMSTTTVRDLVTWNGGFRPTGTGSYMPSSYACVTSTRTLQRRKASPYGFGVTYDGLSLSQKAILTALGISKLSF